MRKLRIVLYSHDTMGLGHIRRNLLIAQTLVHSTLQPNILMITGTPEAQMFPKSHGIDCLTLPALRKEINGVYNPRHLDISLKEIILLRARTICSALEAFRPDVLIVDNVPRGAARELDLTLEYLRTRKKTQIILGLRDVLDDPKVVQHEWSLMQNHEAIQAYYDGILIYGDSAVYDTVKEYGWPYDTEKKAHYIGYLGRYKHSVPRGSDVTGALHLDFATLPDRFMLCMVGGGQDGMSLAEAFAQADVPSHLAKVILTGPYMHSEGKLRLNSENRANPRLRVLEFIPEPVMLLHRADRVVAMGGYNTIVEVLSSGKRALQQRRVIGVWGGGIFS
jgi:predicted glycosyltransferase